jgi:hypothetical protein
MDRGQTGAADPASLAERFVLAFGDPEATAELLSEDAEWWISPTVGVVGSPSVGRDAIVASMRVVWMHIRRASAPVIQCDVPPAAAIIPSNVKHSNHCSPRQ